MRRLWPIFVLMLFFISSCSVKKYLPQGERLYKGYTIKVEKNPETTTKVNSLKKTLGLAARPKRNRFFLGQPYRVWFWYKIGEPKRERGLKAFLRNRLGEPPVLSSKINANATAENMQSLMENLGYFHTTAQGDTSHTGDYFMKAHYTAQVQPRYTIRNIEWVKDSSDLLKLLERNSRSARGLLKSGDPYDLSNITAERDRLDLFLKQRGYYYFNPSYLMAYIDSTVGERKVDVYLNIKKTTPENAKHTFRINSITIYPNYSLSGKPDTVKSGYLVYDSLQIRDTVKKFKPSLFARTITYRPGRLYSSRAQNTSLNRLINLGAFKFVKNRFEEAPFAKDTSLADSNRYKLDAYYYLTPAKQKSLLGQIDGFTKENNYFGTQVSVSRRNRNAFGGAEQLSSRVYGAIERTSGDTVSNTNLRLGTDVTLKIPKYAIPFFRIRENNFYMPNTTFLVGYELYRKDVYYTKNLFRFNAEATFKPTIQQQFTIAPISLSYLLATNITDSFRKEQAVNPSLLLTVFNEAVLGSYATYTWNSNVRSRRNKVYFQAGIDLSGNIAGLITGAKAYRSKNVFGVPFAQYVKLDADYHYTRKLSDKLDLANRLLVGIGLPYNNSRLLPFTKLYTIGGSNSIRGFRARSLGPGSYKPTGQDQRFFQLIGGDYKLLANTELRIKLNNIVSTAVFLDAGNIWTKDTILFGPTAKLTKDFINQIAIAGGVGLRFDVTVLLIRVDLGVPLRKPFLPEGERFMPNLNLNTGAGRRENLVLNIAIGLPF